MKDRTVPCVSYVCAHADCLRGYKDVTVKRCKNCPKYRPRKTTKRPETVKSKREKDRNRHDNWKNQI